MDNDTKILEFQTSLEKNILQTQYMGIPIHMYFKLFNKSSMLLVFK